MTPSATIVVVASKRTFSNLARGGKERLAVTDQRLDMTAHIYSARGYVTSRIDHRTT